MKCVCGYEYEPKFDFPGSPEPKGDERFHHVEGTFILRPEWSPVREVHLYACPKCFTVQANLYS
jgi:hypothetical protein